MISYGYLMPLKDSYIGDKKLNYKFNIKLELDHILKKEPSITINEEQTTIKNFLELLIKSEYEEAKVYISKNYVSSFDIQEISTYFSKDYKFLIKLNFELCPVNCVTNSILVVQKCFIKNKSNIIHFHMINEPDKFSKWKIYLVEKE